jgi:hypothetical protein
VKDERSEVNHIVSNACALSAEDSKGKALSGAAASIPPESRNKKIIKEREYISYIFGSFKGVFLVKFRFLFKYHRYFTQKYLIELNGMINFVC